MRGEALRWIDEIVQAFDALGGAARYSDLYELIERTTSRHLTAEWKATVRRTIEDHSRDSENFRARDLFRHLDRGFWALRDVAVDDEFLAEREQQTSKQIVDKVLVREHWRSLPTASDGTAPSLIVFQPEEMRPIGVWFSKDRLDIELASGLIVSAPLDWFPALQEASARKQASTELSPASISWSELNFSLKISDLLQGLQPTKNERGT